MGAYKKTPEHRKKISLSLMGNVPYNKGIKTSRVLNKLQLLKNGEPIECKHHGFHLSWRLHTHNNVKCKLCDAEQQRKSKILFPLKHILRDAKSHARKRNMEFDLLLSDLEFILSAQRNKCALSGLEFGKDNLPSLDRIDSKLGYTKENVQLVHIKVNIMKSNFDQYEFIELCGFITTYSKAGKTKKKAKK